MKLRLPVSWYHFTIAYLVAMNALAALNLLLAGSRLSTLVLLPLALISGGMMLNHLRGLYVSDTPRATVLDILVMAYMAWALLSGILYFQPGNPSSPAAFVYGLNVQLLPMLLYFAARSWDRRADIGVFNTIVALQFFAAILGLALFFARPVFYTDYLGDVLGRSEDWAIYARLQSYWGSTAMGILSACAIALLTKTSFSSRTRYAVCCSLLVTILLAQQRGAYISGLVATAYFIYEARPRWWQVAAGAIAMAMAGVFALQSMGVTADVVGAIVDNRIVLDILQGDPYGERAVSWIKGYNFVLQFPFGLGLGATTSAATDAGAHVDGQVVDAYYMRVASDLGIPGLMLFLAVSVAAMYSAVRSHTTVAFGAVAFMFAFQLTGTNLLDSYYVSHVYWMILGTLSAQSAGPEWSQPRVRAEAQGA